VNAAAVLLAQRQRLVRAAGIYYVVPGPAQPRQQRMPDFILVLDHQHRLLALPQRGLLAARAQRRCSTGDLRGAAEQREVRVDGRGGGGLRMRGGGWGALARNAEDR